MRLEEESLDLRFESHCDPRLNFEQSLGQFLFDFSLFLEIALTCRADRIRFFVDIAFLLSQAGPAKTSARGGRTSSSKPHEEQILQELASRSNSLQRD